MSRAYRFIVGNAPNYSTTAAGRGWGPGWPTDRSADQTSFVVATSRVGNAAGTTKSITPGQQTFTVHKDVATLIHLLIDETQRRGYPLIAGWCWSFEDRAISGTQSPSNHSWGLAIDFNAPDNPYTSPRVTDFPGWLPDLWASYGFAWGGDYTGPFDSMHLEVMGTPAQAAQALAAAQSELGGGTDLESWMASNEDAVRAIVVDVVNDLKTWIHKELATDSIIGSAAFGPNFKNAVKSQAVSALNDNLDKIAASVKASVGTATVDVSGIAGAVEAKVNPDLAANQKAVLAGVATMMDAMYARLEQAVLAGKLASAPDFAAALNDVATSVQGLAGQLDSK